MSAATAKPLWTAVDNRDDRKEVYYLLTRLPPRLRIRWLKWCCLQCVLPGSNKHATVSPDSTGENTMEVFFDFWSLTNEWKLPPMRGIDALVQVVRDYQRGYFRKGSPVVVHLPR
jgi:hypothetical protein